MKFYRANKYVLCHISLTIIFFLISVCFLIGCSHHSEAQPIDTNFGTEDDMPISISTVLPDQSDVPDIPSPAEESIQHPGYPDYLESVSGLFTYYNQEDSRWGNSLFGPKDPIRTHGCGPTVLAMLVSSYTGLTLTPDIAASWAADNELCVPGDGSSHDIVETGCSAFGLKARPLPDPTVQNVLDELYSGNSLVALVGKGYFSDNGHFLILIKPGTAKNTVRIADSANLENCYHDWPISFILEQLKSNSSGERLLWSISLPL